MLRSRGYLMKFSSQVLTLPFKLHHLLRTRVVSQAQFQIGVAPQKAENRSKIGATSRGVPQKAENRSKIGATVRGGL